MGASASQVPPLGRRRDAFSRWRAHHIYPHASRTALWRTAIAVVGGVVVVVGLALLVLPGPGWVIVFLGLGVLATEFSWARRLLDFTRHRVTAWTRWSARQPVAVRLVIGVLLLLAAAAAALVTLRLVGSPDWLPDLPLVA